MDSQDALQSFLLCERAHLAQHCGAMLAASNAPASMAIDDQPLFRNQEGLFKDRLAMFFERQEALVCGPKVLLE